MSETLEKFDLRINKMDLTIVGVNHGIIKTKIDSEDRKPFEDLISVADAVAIEDGGFHPETYYGDITSIVRKYNLPVYVPDSAKISHIALEAIQIYVGAKLMGLGKLEKKLRKKIKQSLNNEKDPVTEKNKQISRRKLFGHLGKIALGSLLLYGPLSGIINPMVLSEERVADDVLAYSTCTDYRSILMAEGLEKMSKQDNIEERIIFFTGKVHVSQIKTYLENPQFRKKRMLYLPQDLITDTTVKKYIPTENNFWKLVKRF